MLPALARVVSKVAGQVAKTTGASRGIKNVQSKRRVHTSDERFNEQTEGRLARAQLRKGARSKGEGEGETLEETSLNNQGIQQQLEQKGVLNKITKRKSARKIPLLGTTAKWMVFCAVCISYIFQLLFGLLSLLVAVSGEIVSSSFLGSIADLFTDVSSGFESAGIGLWGISALIVFLTFICVWAWYRFSGFNPFETVMSMFITLVLLSMSLLPLMNLFPWLVLWVVYLNTSLLFIKR